jgi:hypothetical protein
VSPDSIIDLEKVDKDYEFGAGIYVVDSRAGITEGIHYYADECKYKVDANMTNQNISEFYNMNSGGAAIGQNLIYLLLYYSCQLKMHNDFIETFNDETSLAEYKRLFQYYMAAKK